MALVLYWFSSVVSPSLFQVGGCVREKERHEVGIGGIYYRRPVVIIVADSRYIQAAIQGCQRVEIGHSRDAGFIGGKTHVGQSARGRAGPVAGCIPFGLKEDLIPVAYYFVIVLFTTLPSGCIHRRLCTTGRTAPSHTESQEEVWCNFSTISCCDDFG